MVALKSVEFINFYQKIKTKDLINFKLKISKKKLPKPLHTSNLWSISWKKEGKFLELKEWSSFFKKIDNKMCVCPLPKSSLSLVACLPHLKISTVTPFFTRGFRWTVKRDIHSHNNKISFLLFPLSHRQKVISIDFSFIWCLTFTWYFWLSPLHLPTFSLFFFVDSIKEWSV